MSSTVEGGQRRSDPLNGETPQSERPETDPDLSDDAMFEVLSNRRRRRVIEYLRDHDGAATVGELAEHIATEENGTTIQQLSSDDRKCVYVSLYQNHLPVMDDANVVDYDQHRKRVRLLDTVSRVEPYLEDDAGAADSRVPVAAILATAGCVLLGSFQVGAFAAIPPFGWALLGAVGLLVVTGVDAWTRSDGTLPGIRSASAN